MAMGYDAKNSWNLTKSNKIRREAKIIDFICRKLDSSQDIKRYAHYNTISPLSSKSQDLDGNIVVQPNVDTSLLETNIINGIFMESMTEDFRTIIFIYSPRSTFTDITGSMFINIDILVSEKYNKQKYGDEKRNIQLAMLISDIFDSYSVDSSDDIYNDVGAIKFDLIGKEFSRVSKTNDYTAYSMKFKIDLITMRS